MQLTDHQLCKSRIMSATRYQSVSKHQNTCKNVTRVKVNVTRYYTSVSRNCIFLTNSAGLFEKLLLRRLYCSSNRCDVSMIRSMSPLFRNSSILYFSIIRKLCGETFQSLISFFKDTDSDSAGFLFLILRNE